MAPPAPTAQSRTGSSLRSSSRPGSSFLGYSGDGGDDDVRVSWIREKVLAGLGVDEEEWVKRFGKDAQDDFDRGQLIKFLDSHVEESAVIFYTLEEDAEIDVEEESTPPSPEPSAEPAAALGDEKKEGEEGAEGEKKEGEGEGEEGEKEEKKEGEEGEKKEGEGEGEKEEKKEGDEGEDKKADDEDGEDKKQGEGEDEKKEGEEGETTTDAVPETTPEEEPAPPKKTTRTVTHTVKVITLHMSLGHIPPHVSELKSMYFLVSEDAPISVPRSATPGSAALDQAMMARLEFGVLVGVGPSVPLVMLQQVLSQVYLPILSNGLIAKPGMPSAGQAAGRGGSASASKQGAAAGAAGAGGGGGGGGVSKVGHDPFRNEFLSNAQKFASQLTNCIKQVDGGETLPIPPIEVGDPQAEVDNFETVSVLENALEEWTSFISNTLSALTQKLPTGKGPLAEIDYWRDINAALSALYEQLNGPRVKKMLQVLELVDAQMLPGFRYQMSELMKHYMEAKDNVKFLTTLERHFKNISAGSLNTILDTLPSMMNAIRMVWIISRHYSSDERMVPLMERIAWEISNRVSQAIQIRQVFTIAPEEAYKNINEARTVLDKWEETYFQVRKTIEESGRDVRWEFDRKKLFDRTRYMSARCADLADVAKVMHEFYQILGPELKAVTGDSAKIDEVLQRVDGLVKPIETVPFDVFDKRYQTSWEAVMGRFNESVTQIDDMTKEFINLSFQNLRSAEGAFDLLQKFKNMQSREVIRKVMMEKYDDILARYNEELDVTEAIFNEFKNAPPVTKNQPPVGGAIAWARSLFQRIKKPVLRFQSRLDLLKRPEGEAITKKYVKIARSIQEHQQNLFSQWKGTVEHVAMQHLKANILDLDDKSRQIVVNFDPELVALIKETKYLDRMGLQVPDTALNVTLQEEKYQKYIEQLKDMLDRYHDVLSKLTEPEQHLLSDHVENLRRQLDPGFNPLNWNSLGIPDFIATCNKAVSDFLSLVNQVQKNASMVKAVVDHIGHARIVRDPFGDENAEVLDVNEMIEKMDKYRTAKAENLAHKYRSIGPLLGKTEELVAGTNTSRAPQLEAYYQFWEKKIFIAITRLIKVSLRDLHQLLINRTSPSQKTPKPCMKIVASLSAPDVNLSPNYTEMQRLIGKLIKNTVETARVFVRWMNGTCMECPPQTIHDPEAGTEPEVVNFTFLDDVTANPKIMQTVFHLTQGASKTLERVQAYSESWNRYQGLWRFADKTSLLEKFSQKLDQKANPDLNTIAFDTRLSYYSRIARDVGGESGEKDIGFVRVALGPLVASIKQEASSWLQGMGKLLNDRAKSQLTELQNRIAKFKEDLAADANNSLDDLKFVLNVIVEINTCSMEVEHEYRSIVEMYRTLDMYGIEYSEAERKAVDDIEDQWHELLKEARRRDQSMVGTKRQFIAVTVKQVHDFTKNVDKFKADFLENGPGSEGITMDEGAELCKTYAAQLRERQEERDALTLAQKLFNLPVTPFPALVEVETDLKNLEIVYDLYIEQKNQIESWSEQLWSELDVNALNEGTEALVIKLRKMPKDLRGLPAYKAVEESLHGFKESVPLFLDLKNEALRDRHWKKLMEVTGVKFEMSNRSFTLQNIFGMQLNKYAETIAEITSGAMKELSIEKALVAVGDTWRNTKFEIAKYTKGSEDRGYVLKGIDDITQMLDDNMMNLQSMSASRFSLPFSKEVKNWEKRLSTIGEVTEIWMLVQRKWMYLESIFVGSDDIRLQLPDEAKQFDGIDTRFKKIMSETAKNPNVQDACHADGRLDMLQQLYLKLENCQKSLSDYLETKRMAFPRFFFISDDELLSILGSAVPQAVQEHMIKLYDNVQALQFGTGHHSKQVKGMTSSEGEGFQFGSEVAADGIVEQWMTAVEAEMRHTLHLKAKEAVFQRPKMNRMEWISQYLGMFVLAGSQIWWTWEVEDVFRKVRTGDKHAMKVYSEKLKTQLDELVALIRSDLTSNDRKKINTLIIIEVHARDVVDRFVRDSILDEREFAWESQVRFYWDRPQDTILMRQCTGVFNYGYEYMGLNGRLVITPLTDRCYMTLTQALSIGLGGSPAGPAGTGKTETVKDLAKSLALLCVVFNCGEGLDYKALGRVFSGLVQCGAWGCFDEFNRIEAEVLSVVSQQIKSIQSAITHGLQRFMFEGREIPIDNKIGIFVTMNPGYAGRTELPDNLKALFRPVTMVVPDLEQICEIMLFSEGFNSAKQLAKKMTVLYKLAKEQLSKQYHYDFGLRALKSVLVMAGALKRGSPDLQEDVVLMRALRDMNAPKFVFEDVPLFLGLIGDLFPGLDCPRVRYPNLNDAIEKTLEDAGYQALPQQADKVVQLYETMLTRHTTMVVGPTGGGKSVVIETLATAQTSLGLTTKRFTINPKAQTVLELYGVLDPNTRDWTDGLLSNIFREVNRPLPPDKKEKRLIVFDGDVDAVWVENMNSVMDDNRILTLPNGERILLAKHCNLLFEVADLQYASPATVSRCGMVYVDPKNLGFDPYFQTWASRRSNKQEAEHLRNLFAKYGAPCVDLIINGAIGDDLQDPLATIIPMSGLNMTRQLCNLFECISDDKSITDMQVLEAVFIFCVMWSFGGGLVDADREKFDAFIKKKSELAVIDSAEIPCGPGQLPGALPTIYEYYFDVENFRWRPWADLVTPFVPPEDHKFSKILVPTVDTVRYNWILNTLARRQQAVLFVGDSGNAKTVIIQDYLRKLSREEFITLNVNFSSRTTSMDMQRTLEDNVDKITKDTYGPPANKKLVVFVDDINMPRVDIYGTQQPIALLKLVVERKGMYDRGKDLKWKNLLDVQFIAAMGPPGGGRNAVDPRFVSLFNMFNISSPSQDSLYRIYDSILEAHLDSFSGEVKNAGSVITKITLELYEKIVQTLPPTPTKFHYIFNLRDLSRVYEGLWQVTPDIFDSEAKFVRLWRNECLRVFHDRLTNDTDRKHVQECIEELVKENFPETVEHVMQNPILFGDWRNCNNEDLRLYEDLGDYNDVRPVTEEALENYNYKNKAMNLVMFDDALAHLARIERILRLGRGNALLVGVGGSGKQSLTKLAAFMAGYKTFSITLARNYGETEFREDLKSLYTMLGAEGEKVVFLFTDAHVADEGFLENINNMLTSGVVPALFDESEKDGLINSVREEVKKAGLYDTKETCWSWFIDKCRDNLRIVLCMSPVGDLLRRRCRNFPGLVSNTVIDWYEAWPEQALKSVAEVFLEHEDLPDDCRQGIVEHMVMVHLDVTHKSREYEQTMRRYNYVTPKNFLDYISNYKTSLNENRKKFTKMTNRFAGGLEKLVQASEEVDTMSVQLAESKIIVEQKKKENDILLVKIDEATKQATEKQVVATQREEELVELNKQISIDRADAEQALEEALPALQAAKDALKNLNKSDLTEVRSFAKPPIMVEKVVECVSILKGIKELNWKLSKTMMAAPDFINSLIHFDTNKLTEKQVRSVKEYFKISKFTPSELTSVSRAAAGLLTWVYAMVNFYGVYKTVAPKRQAVANLEKQMAKGEKDLADVKEEVRQLNQELEDLGKQFEQSTKEATELSEKAALMEKRMAAAKRLIAGLGTEKIRWAAEVEELKEKRKKLVGDCLLSSSFLSYLGAFNQTFRQQMLYDTWEKDVDEKNVPKTGKYRVEELLADEVVLSTWASDGLPGDELSVQNGILTTYASRYPLCIDPQLQAINWIKKKESKNNLKVATFNDPDFLKHLELCISYGQPFLFENLDEYIDPIIDSVLERNLQSVGNRKFIVLGDKEVDWDDSFRLFMTTKLQNPHYSPEVFGKTSIINYSVTQQGLSDQLLNVVVGHERADLEKERSALIQSMSDNRVTLKGLEDTLLSELSDSTGLILDNTELIETLEDTKTKATEVSDKIEQAAQTAKELDAVRGGYRPAAKRGSILFFVLSGLSAIDSMYEYALGSYLELFELSLRKSKMEPQLVKRLHNIITTLTYNVYTYGCTGLFEKHKLMFSLQMTLAIIDGENELDHTELDFFLKGNIALEKGERKCPYSWIPAQGWEDLQRLITINEKFENIVTDVEQNEGPWKAWYDLEAPEQTALPQDYDEKLENSSFRKLCVLKCFRPDRVFLAVKQFVIDKMGTKFVEPPVINYENIFEQSSPFSPLVFILSPGADPASNINALAEKLGFGGNKLKMASLGQGQGPIAEAHLETGATRGQWVVLQNCHLLTRWLKTLEKILETIEKPHKDFRLWLTTEPTPEFPMGILQRSMKVVTEPPNGLRLNMRSTYAKITEETLSQCTHTAFRPLVYVLAFFHAVVQERRKYGKVGWNVPYDFNDSDFRVSMLVLSTYLTKAQENKDAFIPWESLKYLIGEAMYGGRVSDAWDRRILNTYLNEYMGDFLFDTFQPFHFYQAEGMDYKVPPAGTRDEYAEAVENLPLLETPGVFGLHSNAEISYLTNSTKTLWRDLIDLQPRTTGSATGVSREDFIGQVAKDIKGKLPNDFDLQMIKKNIGVPSPTQIVLLQELDRFSRLLTLMATTLSDLQKALVGEIGMSNELDDIANSIFIGELPASWRRLAPMTQKSLGNWLEHFHRRHEQYANWVNNGEPAVVWLAGLHIPEAYLTALVQSTCRARGWPLDRSTLYTKVTKYTNPKQVTTKLPSGCFVSGLYLEGAGWDHGNSRLKPQEPKQLVVDLPILQIIPIEASKLKLQNTFKTPVYVTQQRMDAMGVGLVFEADIPVADHASHSVLQGVALVLNTD